MSDQSKYDDFVVKIYSCPVPFPFTFAVHTYIVFEHDTTVVRYDVNPIPLVATRSELLGHMKKDMLPPEVGFRLLGRFSPNFVPRYKVNLIAKISGDADSIAGKLYAFMASGGLATYPHSHTYRFIFGPNSNTFTQWVIDQVPHIGLSLPWNAWGKSFKY